MIRKEITIQLDSGLDTRPVALLVQVASQFKSDIHLESGIARVNAKSIMGMMTLGLVIRLKLILQRKVDSGS